MNRPTQTILHSGKFLAFIKEGHWEYVNRVNATGAALILAVTAEQKILLVEQYRIPVHARTIELPAGIIGDEPGCSKESQAEAARRELLEETGYAADNFVPLMTGSVPSTAAMVTLVLSLVVSNFAGDFSDAQKSQFCAPSRNNCGPAARAPSCHARTSASRDG
jgi:ADP-ribose pyrophosphatase